MHLDIQKLPDPDHFVIQGQTVHRFYAEGALLAGMFAVCHKNIDKMLNIVDQFEAAGLSTRGYPTETRKAHSLRASLKREQDKREADAKWFAERSQQMAAAIDPVKIAERRAERQARDAERHAQFARVRLHGSSVPYALQGMDDEWT